MIVRRALVVLAVVAGCASPREPRAQPAGDAGAQRAGDGGAPADAASETGGRTIASDAVMGAMLIAHIEDTKRRVSHAALGAERVWTDGAILERATELPPPVDAHLRRVGPGPVPREQMVDLLDQVERARPRGHEAALVRDDGKEFACRFDGGGVSARTNCIYANYVEARYPTASFVVTGPYDPVLVAVGPTIRAVIMPVK